jgi:hypothetical protein
MRARRRDDRRGGRGNPTSLGQAIEASGSLTQSKDSRLVSPVIRSVDVLARVDLRPSGLMAPHLPQLVNLIAATVAAAAMVVLGLGKHMLEARSPKRCAACGRLTELGRRCVQCG